MRHLFFAAPLILSAFPSLAQMTDAAQIRPILDATKANWIAVRKWEGEDLIYFTHLETWRCGLDGVKFGVNTETPDQIWDLAPCDESNPNALPDGYLPFTSFELNSIETVTVEITYDDGKTDIVTFNRGDIEIQ